VGAHSTLRSFAPCTHVLTRGVLVSLLVIFVYFITRSHGKSEPQGLQNSVPLHELIGTIKDNCGEYAVNGRGKWGGVCGLYAKSSRNWHWGRWELLRKGLGGFDGKMWVNWSKEGSGNLVSLSSRRKVLYEEEATGGLGII
jgi:hypothetical protein